MSRSNGKGRRISFPQSGRIPIIGAEPKSPTGRHYYRIVYFIRREGMPLDAGENEMWFPSPINGMHHSGAAEMVKQKLIDRRPDLIEPEVIIVATHRLGFVSDEERERQARAAVAQPETVQ